MFDMASKASLSQNILGAKTRDTPAVNVPTAMPAKDLPTILSRAAAQSRSNTMVNIFPNTVIRIVRTSNAAPTKDESGETKRGRTEKQPIQTLGHHAHSIPSNTH
eukprot:TRINITY_DN1890_c0_g1_i2.p1 TRINITY_DN1890_c0_g1~~TRINITY_DN1890_c0_g1_i2.p1  ORF type:complete len:105 (+),score=2.51 TRINITY_DN1890_c0_g1_i2:277-591(+)